MTRFFPQPTKSVLEKMRHRAGIEVRLKAVIFKKRRCNIDKLEPKYAHAHHDKEFRYYGQICINPKFLEITPLHGIDWLMAHEVAHFFHVKHGRAHSELTLALFRIK